MEWTDDIISRLQTLWQEGLSTAEIGRQLSITKNAVVGKAHRLGLPPRPSPIRATAKPRKEPVAEVSVSSGAEAPVTTASVSQAPVKPAEPKASVASESTVASPAKPSVVETVAASVPKSETVQKPSASASLSSSEEGAPLASKPSPIRKSAEAKTMSPDLMLRPLLRPLTADTSPRRGPSCCWPNGDPGTPGFHFCGAKPVAGKPYCAEHCAIAYVKLRDRRENAG
ncbi:GcrA family cell cycle regulator [Asaia astilbis]|uniref:GcrA family cell cycle regulator n=1 Tax=Asaia astilbis TaxID=610244 RepID=UPI000470B5DE|nr:GcrA family cell cycle regulator [Asaia astilbis]